MRAFFVSIAKKITYVIAAFIILAAIIVSISQLFTPVLEKHRADVEKWASQLLEMPVTIDKVRISWYRYHPEIRLDQVTILNKTTKEPVLQIESVSVFFSIPKSLWERQFVPSGIMISGTDVNVHEVATGEYDVQGFPSFGGFNTAPYQRESKFADIVTWLSSQPSLILNNVNIRYTGFSGQKRFITLYNLSLVNSDEQHIILGKAVLHQEIPTEITVSAKWLGKSVDLSQIRARIYLYVSGFSISQWFKGFTWNNWKLNNGIGSAKIWAIWHHGAFQKIQTTFQLYDLELFSSTDKSLHKINRLSGNAGWKREGQNQIFAGDDILIDLPSHLWPVTSFYVSLAPDAKGTLKLKAADIGYVDLNDAQAFLFSMPSPLMSDATRKLLLELKLNGALQNAVMTFSGPWSDWNSISLNANFSQLGFASWHGFPAVSNLSGVVKWNGKQGNLSLHSIRTQFEYSSIFTNPIDIDQLSGDIAWQQDKNNAWLFNIQSLQLLNNDGAANVNGTISMPAKASSPMADLRANFTLQKVSHVSRYLPMRAFSPELVKWLRGAFLSGEVQSGSATLRGSLVDFPFDHHNGTFLVSSTVKNVDLVYAPDWPVANRMNGKVTFSGRQMTVNIDSATILNIPITNVYGEIPYLGDAGPQILKVQSDTIAFDFSQGLKFLQSSPLKETIGKMFSDMEASGPVALKLSLTMPLSDPSKTQVLGDAIMKDAKVNLIPWKLTLDNLNGQFHFTEDTAEAKNIAGQLFNKPAKLSFKTIQKAKNVSVVQATLTSNLNISDLEEWLKVPFSKVATGSADIESEIDFSLNAPLEIKLHSNLVGVSINLPDQYGKKEQEARDFAAEISIQEKAPLRVKLTYDDLLAAALILNRKHEEFSLIGANIQLGKGSPSWPEGAGLYITGSFDQLDWDKIKGYVGQTGNMSFANLPLRKIDISAKAIDILGQHLTQVQVELQPIKDRWDISIVSPEVVGDIQAPANFTTNGSVSAQFQKLNLRSMQGSKQINHLFNAKSLPSISFIANNVSYNNMPLGQVTFKTSPSAKGLNIQSLQIVSPRMNLQATGEWTQSNVTRLQGSIKSTNVSELLNSFGLGVQNFISETGRLDFKFNWNNAPYAPSLQSLNGTASLDLAKGRIVDVGQASEAKMDIGRMLSIFSLQTIPRRLSLNFSDIFHKGYSFDYVRGNFVFRNGDAFTNDLRFDGPIARVGIDGRIGLKNKDYDFILNITPYNLTSGIPVAAALLSAGNPIVGLAAFAVNSVISPAISKAATYHYAVKGPWNNPSWTSVSATGK